MDGLSLGLKAGKDQCSMPCSQAGGDTSYKAFLFYSGPQLIGWATPSLSRAICFTQSTDSNVNLIRKHPHKDNQENF